MKRIIIIFTLMALLLVGCGEDPNVSAANKDYSSMVTPNILECGGDKGTDTGIYYYVIDRNNGVVYLAYDAYRKHALTIMVNRDGSPITAEQLGIKY